MTTAAAADVAPPTEIVVEGTRRVDRGTSVDRVGERRLEQWGATSVGESLERLPSFSAGGSSRGERILSLRGFDQRQIAVFVDGVPIYVPYDGQLDLSKLPIDMVSRVTVVKGASSLLYGPNGLGGAVNVSTRAPTESLSLRASAEISPGDSVRAGAAVGDTFGPVGGVVGASFQEVRSWPLSSSFTALPNQGPGDRTNSDRLAGSFATKWIWDVAPRHQLTLTGSRFEGRFGVPPATRDFTVRDWRWTDWASTSVGLGHSFRGGGWELESLAYFSAFGNTLDSYDDLTYSSQRLPKAFHSVYDDTATGAFARTSYEATVVGRALSVRTWTGVKHDTHASVADVGAEAVRVSTTLLTTSALAELDALPRWVRVSVGAQLDAELPGATSGPSPDRAAGLGPIATIAVTPTKTLTVSASAAERTRFPTLRERFSAVFGAREPNPGLRPERAWNLSLDVAYQPVDSMRFAAGLFDSELRDLVTSVIVAPQTDRLQNVGEARYYGAEAEISLRPWPWLELLAAGMALHARAGDGLDQPLAYRPARRGLGVLTLTPIPSLAITFVARHTGEQRFQNPDTGLFGRLGGYQLYDARVDWAFHPSLRAFVRATNLTDANVEAHYSFPEPGRQLFVGVASRVGA